MNFDQANSFKGDILIVDDSLENLRVLSSTLEEYGYEVRCVKSGTMALLGIQIAPPDLILLDIRMPDLDGYEVCQQLKANPQTCGIPVIFLSALDDVLDKVKAFEAGGIDYITKPFQVKEVIARVESQLTIRRLQKQIIEKNQRLQQEILEHQQTEEILRQEIHHRTLTEIALQEAKEAAEAANQAKSEFLSNMSHELRTPLNAILGFTQLIQNDSTLAEEHRENLETISRSGQHLLELINKILTIARVETNSISLNKHRFDLYRLLTTLKAVWQSKAKAKGLQLVIERAPNVPQYVYSDESKLNQILMNLLENALKFTTEGWITLRIWGQQDRDILKDRNSNRQINSSTELFPVHAQSALSTATFSSYINSGIPYILSFEVEDTGFGIANSELGHLFEVFAQTTTGRRLEQGVGLGLSISQQFVHQLGGDITVRSIPEQGTIVQFYILVDLNNPEDLTNPMPGWQTSVPDEECLQYIPFSHPMIAQELTTEVLQAAMPSEWITQLYQAAIKGFDRQVLKLIEDIPPAHASLAKILRDWTNNFWFDKIVDLTKQVVE